MHSVYRGAPSLLTTRWVMSYPAGPMTLAQVRSLSGAANAEGAQVGAPSDRDATHAAVGPAAAAAVTPAAPSPQASPAVPIAPTA